MIVFLTLCYIAVLAALVKLGAIRLNTFWKLSPILWMLALLILLFIPMQWGAPSGTVLDYQTVVEIIPNVSGEVVEVPVKPREQLEKGDVRERTKYCSRQPMDIRNGVSCGGYPRRSGQCFVYPTE